MGDTDSTHNLTEPKKEMMRGELYIERLPEIFNRQAYKGGVRTIVRRNQKLEIGLQGWSGGFSHHEYLVLVELLLMWHELGCPESGEIYRENTRLSLSEFTDNLYGDERKFRTGGNYRTKVEKWIKNLLSVPLVHHVYTPLEDGKIKVSLGSFTFLSAADGIFEKKGRYFDLSKITIHPTIVKSILSHHVKPMRLDVIRTLHGDNEILFYREIDLILSKRNEFSRPLVSFCNDLGIHYQHERHYTSKAKVICKNLIGKPLSSGGIIGFCFLEVRDNVQSICARKEMEVKPPQQEKEKPITPAIPHVPTKAELENIEFKKRREFLEKHYDQFSKFEKEKVNEICNQLLKNAPYNQMATTIEHCHFEAIERVLKQEFAKENIFQRSQSMGVLVAKESPSPGSEYRPDTVQKLRSIRNLLSALHRVSYSKVNHNITYSKNTLTN